MKIRLNKKKASYDAFQGGLVNIPVRPPIYNVSDEELQWLLKRS